MPDASLRRATRDDVPRLVELMERFYAEACFPLDRAVAAESFEALLQHPDLGVTWLLEAGGEPAGYVVLTLTFSMEYGGFTAFVDDLFVIPDARGGGLGRVALEELFTECRRRGVRAVHLEVGRDNTVAKRLYHSFGFRDNDRQLLTVRLDV